MKIMLAIASLSRGGSERVVLSVAEGLFARGHDVTLLVSKPHEENDYPVPTTLNYVCLDGTQESQTIWQAFRNNIFRLKRLKHALKKSNSDVVIAIGTETAIRVLLVAKNLNVIISGRDNPRIQRVKTIWALLRRITYPRSFQAVFPSMGVSECYHWLKSSKRQVIYNPIENNWFKPTVKTPPIYIKGRKYIVSAGRMDYNKGFDRLISCFQSIAQKFPDWNLIIWGDGPERQALLDQIQVADLEDRIHLPGQTENMKDALGAADVFAFSSRSEGFPNILLEAMAVGLPSVVFDIDFGPKEIIVSPEQGYLIPDDNRQQYSEALTLLMENADLRHTMGKSSQERARFFSLDKTIDEWESLLKRATKTWGTYDSQR